MKQRRLSPGRRIWAAIVDAFTRDIGLKSMCLACALLLVAYQRNAADEKVRSIAFAVDVQMPPDESDRELMTPLPPSIKVTVQGSTGALDELANKNPTVELDLRAGDTSSIRFSAEQLDVPPGVKVKFIDPPGFDLEWQDIVTRNVPIQSAVTGRVADGHEVAKLSVEPENVELRGPSSLVRVTQLVRAAPFDITGLTAGVYQRQLALDPAPSRTHYVERASATVNVEIRQRLITVNFPKLAVEVLGLPGAKVVPLRVDVSVRGTPEVVGALQPELVVPRVDASKVDSQKHGSAALPVLVDLSHAEAEVQPPTVKVSW